MKILNNLEKIVVFFHFFFVFFLFFVFSATETNKPQKLFFISFSFQILLKELVEDSFTLLMMNNQQKLEQYTFITLLITHNAIIYLVQSERQRNRSQLIKYYWESRFGHCYHLVNVNSLTLRQIFWVSIFHQICLTHQHHLPSFYELLDYENFLVRRMCVIPT